MINTTEIPNPFPAEHPVKAALKQTPAYAALRFLRDRMTVRSWEEAGCPLPLPMAAQHAIVRSYAERFRPPIFIETGTFKGQMLDTMRRYGRFRHLHSIELQPTLALLAAARFAKDHRIRIHQGNSAEVLPSLLQRIAEPVLFWLDGHYSGEFTACGDEESPVRHELRTALAHAKRWRLPHVILVDNLSLFDGRNGYPTLAEVEGIVQSHCPGWKTVAEHDIVRITPRL